MRKIIFLVGLLFALTFISHSTMTATKTYVPEEFVTMQSDMSVNSALSL